MSEVPLWRGTDFGATRWAWLRSGVEGSGCRSRATGVPRSSETCYRGTSLISRFRSHAVGYERFVSALVLCIKPTLSPPILHTWCDKGKLRLSSLPNRPAPKSSRGTARCSGNVTPHPTPDRGALAEVRTGDGGGGDRVPGLNQQL